MGKKLIIAEKPSLAKNICKAISPAPKWVAGKHKNSGYYENSDYIVSYAFGHLLQLQDAEDYNPDWKKWDVDDLPIFPEEFIYKKPDDAGAKAQLTLLSQLIKSKDVDGVYNAGDSDREGEIIVRNILDYAGCKKTVYRLWLPDQTEGTIKAAIKAMELDSKYDNLANEGYARTYIDWLYGINLTRLVTKKAGTLLRIGRVTTPIVVAICERERAIRNFKPETYYVIVHNEDGVKLQSKEKYKTRKEAEDAAKKYNSLPTEVTEVKTERKNIARPKLFALSDLQAFTGKAFKYSPKDTLDILQTLYEDGYCTYPRTNSQYMAEKEKQKAKDILKAIGDSRAKFRDTKAIFDDSKIEAHSAITPTTKMPVIANLTPKQKNVYETIKNRFLAAFCDEEYTVDKTTIVVSNGVEDIKVSGNVIVTKGWTVFEGNNKKDDILPPLKKGDKINPNYKVEEKQTEPPPHYTVETLNKYLKNPYAKGESEDEEASEVELGTEATRAGLIDGAIKSGYITLASNKYGITDKGEYYVDSLTKLSIDMTKERTLSLGKALKEIYRGKQKVLTAVESAKTDLRDICKGTQKIAAVSSQSAPMQGNVICKCKFCGKDVVEAAKVYKCNGCGSVIFKEDKFFAKNGKPMTTTIAKSIFTKGYVDVKGFTSARTGKEYDARVNVTFGENHWPNYTLEFNNSK